MRTKRSLLYVAVLVSFLFIPDFGRSQGMRGQSEICGGVGIQSFYKLIENAFSNSGDVDHSSGVYNMSYRYYLTNRFTLGLNVAYEHTHDWHAGSLFFGKNDWATIAPEVTFSYMDKAVGKHIGVRLYWLAAWGVTLYSGTNGDGSSSHGYLPLGIQITPIGFRVGGDLAGFMEMGFGYKGLLSAGASYRVPKKKHVSYSRH